MLTPRALRPLLARFSPSLRHKARSETEAQILPPPALPIMESGLIVPIRDDSEEEHARNAAHVKGQFLARQDRWEDLAREMRAADQDRAATPGNVPICDLLSFGARSDVVNAVEHVLIEGKPASSAPLLEGIAALEEIRIDLDNDPYITTLVAQTHMDIGWAWRGNGWEATVPRLNREKHASHFDRATDLMTPLCASDLDSPTIAATCCALKAGRRDRRHRLADDYERLIDLDPMNYRHMRALGNHLLPRWFGSYEDLELEARRSAARTQAHWGAGGYTWVQLDAIAIDEEACARVDVDFFIDGMRDILRVCPDQATVNLLAAYCSVTLLQGLGMLEEADLPRVQIAECAGWLIRDHLTEVHPLIWAHAAEGFDNNARITSLSRFAARGKADALQIIAEHFRDDLERGLQVVFTPDGPQIGAT